LPAMPEPFEAIRERSMSETFLSSWQECDFEGPLARQVSWPPSSFTPSHSQRPIQRPAPLILPLHDKARAFQWAPALSLVDGNQNGISGDEHVSCCTMLLWAIIGTSGWWSTNVICAQLPLLLEEFTTEGPRLGNKVSAMTQLGNLGLAAYMLARRRVPMDPASLVYVMLVLGFVTLAGCSLMCCSAELPSESGLLLALALVAGCVGCTLSVHFWTLLLLYPPKCTLGASVGMSAGGVLANIFSCAQLCGRDKQEPRFGSALFFAGAAAFQLLTLVCFLLVKERGQQRSFYVANFTLHAFTYLLPTLMPYVAAAYPLQERQLYFYMLVCQQCGETTGRSLVATSNAPAALSTAMALLILTGLTFGAVWPEAFAAALDAQPARVVVPAACFLFFLTYGMLQTTVFQRIRCMSPQQHVAEDISAMTGSCGQLGSLVVPRNLHCVGSPLGGSLSAMPLLAPHLCQRSADAE